jgi:hypothetical protein
MLKIEKGIPAPPVKKFRRQLPKEVVMEIGDSAAGDKRFCRALRSYGTRRGWTMTWKEQDDGTIRVWRNA